MSRQNLNNGETLGTIRTKINANDTELYGILEGGTTGQVLKKNSDSDLDIDWANESGGGSLPSGGTDGQIIWKQSATEGDASWDGIKTINGQSLEGTGNITIASSGSATAPPDFVDAETVYSLVPNSVSNQDTEFSNMLNGSSDAYIKEGTYEISTGIIASSGSDITIKGAGIGKTIINVTGASTGIIIRMQSKNIKWEDITFDYGDGYCGTGLYFDESIGTVTLNRLKFQNIRDTNQSSSSLVVGIENGGNEVDIHDIWFDSILKQGDGTIGGAAGNITGIYMYDQPTVAGVHGIIENVYINEMHNLTSGGAIAESPNNDDTSCIYPISSYSGNDRKLFIKNVVATNPGRRVIKIDCEHIYVDGVRCDNIYSDTLAAVGMSGSKDNISISNVYMTGKGNIGVATYGGNNVNVTNCHIDIISGTYDGNFGITVQGDNLNVSNCFLRAERPFAFLASGTQRENIRLTNSTLIATDLACIYFQSSGAGIYNFVVDNVNLINENASITSFSGMDMINVPTSSCKGIFLSNISIEAAASGQDGIQINNCVGSSVRNIYAKAGGSFNDLVEFDNCTDGLVDTLFSDATVTTKVDTTGSTNIQTVRIF